MRSPWAAPADPVPRRPPPTLRRAHESTRAVRDYLCVRTGRGDSAPSAVHAESSRGIFKDEALPSTGPAGCSAAARAGRSPFTGALPAPYCGSLAIVDRSRDPNDNCLLAMAEASVNQSRRVGVAANSGPQSIHRVRRGTRGRHLRIRVRYRPAFPHGGRRRSAAASRAALPTCAVRSRLRPRRSSSPRTAAPAWHR